jgi:hypothetical protein
LPNEIDPIFDVKRFMTALRPVLAERLGGDGIVKGSETRAGTFNRVIKFTYAGRHLGVRVAVDQRHFRYERDIVKEVFAMALLRYAGEEIDDERVAVIIESLLAKPRGGDLGHDSVRSILYYDWSMTDLPYPFFLFDWVEGPVLWEKPFAEHYHESGKLLAGIHQVRFENFYDNVFTIHQLPRSWRDHFRVCLNRELARAEIMLPPALFARLNGTDMSHLTAGQPCLVHNDFAGANIVIDQQLRPHAIDWDNWVVDCAELDLVKMKYWTAIGQEGRLTHRPELFEAFMAGYCAHAPQPIDEQRLKAYEYLWLLRCFNFENSSIAAEETASAGNSWRPVYPGASYYLDLLRDL